MKKWHHDQPPRFALATAAAAATALLLLPTCTDRETASNDSPTSTGIPVVQTVNYPLTYFAERIGGDRIDVQFRAPEDGDPAFWEPGDADIAALQKADLILLNGAKYAKWRDHVSLPESILVDTSAAFAGKFIEVKSSATHSHGKEGEHSHAGTAFTTWIDFGQARQQTEAIRDALIGLVPDAKGEFEANAAGLIAGLDQLDADLEAAAKSIGGQPLVASHPVYQYLARRYGLAIEAVLWEPETVPDDAAMKALQDLLATHPAKWMLWEGDPAPDSVEKLKAIGVSSVVFDPCGNRPGEGDWLSVMRQNVENLKAIR